MDKKILFIGDSWVTNFFGPRPPHDKTPIYQFWKEKGFNPHFIGNPGRDTQTILDIWIKYIPYLSEEDLLVIILPVFSRTRLPKTEYGNLHIHKNIPNFHDYFVGSNSFTPTEMSLEIWGTQHTKDYFKKNLETQELINGSNASILNFIEIVDSLSKITPCKKIVHCWDYKKYNSDNIIYREEMTNLIGSWETIEDGHWNSEMNMKFMEFLIKYFNKN